MILHLLTAFVLGAVGTVLYLAAYRRWIEKDQRFSGCKSSKRNPTRCSPNRSAHR
jgi:hypothetical protein